MLQNIKVDVIYYFTSTDFEMEFNLCGCCRMRLLTDKAADRKGFIHMLSRAVSRSRVIICCGPLFGDTGLIKGVAAAIGKSVVTVDNSAYGIKDSAEIGIIEGAMPLVTSDGIFGGCIIESGPQAIIMLSESKAIRKNIMTSLIHPYIEELSVTPVKTGASSSPEETAEEPTVTENTDGETVNDNTADVMSPDITAPAANVEDAVPDIVAPEQAEESADEQADAQTETESAEPETVAEETAAEPEIPLAEIADSEESAPEDQAELLSAEDMLLLEEDEPEEEEHIPEDINDGLYIEAQQVKFTKKNYYDVDYEAGADSYQYYAEPEPIDCRFMFRLPILIITVVLLIALLILAYFLVFVPMRDGYTFSEYFKEIFAVASVGIKPL